MSQELIKIGLKDLIKKNKMSENDIIILQDTENTKRISFADFKDSLIEDGELPSTHRIYSSQKIDDYIKDFQKQLSEDMGKLSNSITNITNNYITSKQVDDKITDFSKQVSSLAEVETIKKALESKRNITDTITCDDLESGSNDKKIQLKNLSSEVISAMSGDTPVTPPSVPNGGWVQEDIADKAINSQKLSKQYRYKGHYPEGNINDFTADGLYLLGASVSGLPKYDENETDQDRLLEVTNFGPDQYIIQTIYYCLDNEDNVRPIYKRKALLSRLTVTDFVAEYPVTDTFKINRSILTDDILNCGVISTGNVYDIVADGDYLVKQGVKNLPDDTHDFTVSVRNYNTRIEYNAKIINTDLCEIYISNSYLTSMGARQRTEWKRINSIVKSRLEGKRVHLFGDEICFGEGSTDYSSLSYPALLTSKYGLVINNRAQGDSTIGNYDNNTFAEKSVIKQIENATVYDNDLAIIFAGGNDYKSGISKIGNNFDINDTTFKGSLNTCIQKLLSKNPTIKLLIISPIFRARLNAGDNRNSDDTPINELYLRNYANAMKEVCEYNHIPFLDLHSNSMINKYNYSSYLKDNLYPNNIGQEMLANKIFAALNYFY